MASPRPSALPSGAPPQSFLPTSASELRERGWDGVDVILVSGDAYVDHPSFAAAILGRWLEHHGFRVAILAQPAWSNADAWRELGPPRLFYGVSAGNMDSMINHYTANRKRRNSDAYSPGGAIGLRPDRATAVYAQRCREAFPGIPVVIGGVEASLRRIAHYDYWSDRVRPASLASSKADLLVYGMGESRILEIARRLAAGDSVRDLRDLRGTAYLLGRKESLPAHLFESKAITGGLPDGSEDVRLPSYDEVASDKRAFAIMTRDMHRETNPRNARRLLQSHGDRLLVINPPALPLEEATLDAIYDLPYTRQPHPRYAGAEIPAWRTIAHSVQIMRGCFGGCTFCSITMHQGRTIESRSADSVLNEVHKIASTPGFHGHISDLGGPTANMYRMRCSAPEIEAVCRRPSCIHPSICKQLDTSHAPTLDLMRRAREVPGVKKVHVASGIRMDLARNEPEYLEELARHHVGGHLKVAPEHVSERVLGLMKKPSNRSFDDFAAGFERASHRAGREQYLVPYFIASHPGSTADDMIELALFLKRRGYRPQQVQDFIPAPMDVATCMYYTGLSPYSLKPVASAKGVRERRVQRALLQFFKPENYFEVRQALLRAGRGDLIGAGPDCLIPSRAPRAALTGQQRRDAQANSGEPARSSSSAPSSSSSPSDGAKASASPAANVRPGYRAAARRGSKRKHPRKDSIPS